MSKDTITTYFSTEEERDAFVGQYTDKDNENYGSCYIETRDANDDRYEAILDRDEVESLNTLHDDLVLSGGKVDLND